MTDGMECGIIKQLLVNGAKQIGIELSESQVEKFFFYQEVLLDWNKRVNLTGLKEPREIIIKHFLDSLSCLTTGLFTTETRLIDIGSGAGFPGVPIKICWPETRLTLLDSQRRRILFLKELIEKLSLPDIEVFHGRAEDCGHLEGYREGFDLAVCRAVGGLSTLLELALPFLKVDGVFIAMKGHNVEVEIAGAKKAMEILGGDLQGVKHFTLPFTNDERTLILIKKRCPTPIKYPRRAGIPKKRPL